MIPKFRFWYEREDYYPDENYMRHVWGIEYITDGKIELNDDYIFNPYTNVAENIYAKTKIYLMQSTGLKDKNGAEIYEGDVITSEKYPYQSDGEYNYHGVVEWDGENVGFIVVKYAVNPLIGGISDGMADRFEEIDEVEILGNIYENPELLEAHT